MKVKSLKKIVRKIVREYMLTFTIQCIRRGSLMLRIKIDENGFDD